MAYQPRPYLVIPKLVEQPTWGGQYIAKAKGWQQRGGLGDRKIGQSYELFSGSNLSLLDSTDDPNFVGELTNNTDVETQTYPEASIPISHLISGDPDAVLGPEVVAARGATVGVLVKFTQALGNSFQVHMKDGQTHPMWKPKLEAWYFFEPGVLTLGIKPGTDWGEFEAALRAVSSGMSDLGNKISAGDITYEQALTQRDALLRQYDPWQYVNQLEAKANDLVDLTQGGLHHSWEEDSVVAPQGNILIEMQTEAMDNISTFRGFDKGKIGQDGSVRNVHIDQYFEMIDRTPETNDPQKHLKQPVRMSETDGHTYDQLLVSRHFVMDQLELLTANAMYEESIDRYKYVFVRDGAIKVTASGIELTVGAGHSCFIPANCGNFKLTNVAGNSLVVISY